MIEKGIPMRSRRIDVLRGLAIIGVLSVHTALVIFNEDTQTERFFLKFFSIGKYGVELFFFVSGFLLYKLYGNGSNRLGRKYFLRRLTRIYPLWILFLFLNIALTVWFESNSEMTYLQDFASINWGVVSSLTLGATFMLFWSGALWNNVIPGGWSIQAEVAHYFLFPWLRKLQTWRLLYFLVSVNVFTILVYYTDVVESEFVNGWGLSFFVEAWLRLSLYSTIGFFILGGITGKFLDPSGRTEFYSRLRSYPLKYKSVALGYFVTFVFLPCPFGSTIQALIFLIAAIFVGGRLSLYPTLGKFLGTCGEYSYFIYFFHFMVLHLTRVDSIHIFIEDLGFLGFPFVFGATLMLSLMFAYPSMKFFERPFMNLSR
jgi:peptidoglycan/LPS O-acetylase OafA/YrhL